MKNKENGGVINCVVSLISMGDKMKYKYVIWKVQEHFANISQMSLHLGFYQGISTSEPFKKEWLLCLNLSRQSFDLFHSEFNELKGLPSLEFVAAKVLKLRQTDARSAAPPVFCKFFLLPQNFICIV